MEYFNFGDFLLTCSPVDVEGYSRYLRFEGTFMLEIVSLIKATVALDVVTEHVNDI